MQILESLISFLVLISLSIFILIPADSRIDNSLYLYELQGDVKNVMHLKGGFVNITKGNEIAMEIFYEANLCMEMSETDITSYIVKEGLSTSVMVPQLKGSNLTGFRRNEFKLGTCNN